VAVIAEDFARRQHQRGRSRPADVLDTEALVEQPLDEFGTLLARRSVETVKQAQRLEIEVCRHSDNLEPIADLAATAVAQYGLTIRIFRIKEGADAHL
jgi:hypothetical protein